MPPTVVTLVVSSSTSHHLSAWDVGPVGQVLLSRPFRWDVLEAVPMEAASRVKFVPLSPAFFLH